MDDEKKRWDELFSENIEQLDAFGPSYLTREGVAVS